MNLDWFQDLKHLARTGNFSQAAALSNVSQPTLTRRVQALETWVGVRLVDRSRQPVQLTMSGKQFLEVAEQCIERLQSERQILRETASEPDRSIVTFAAQHAIGWRFYPQWLQAFEAAYQPLLTRLRASDLPDCFHDLSERQVDFVLAYQDRDANKPVESDALGVGYNAQFEAIRIGTDRLIPVCKPCTDGQPLFNTTTTDSNIPFLSYGDDAYLGKLLSNKLKQKKLHSQLHSIYENSMTGALRIRARDGMGIAWLPESLVQPDIDAGLLCYIAVHGWTITLDICLLRNIAATNSLTRDIWSFLEQREDLLLLAS